MPPAITERGATERFDVSPDPVALAKTPGGGLPSVAIGMTSDLADFLSTGRCAPGRDVQWQSALDGRNPSEPQGGAHIGRIRARENLGEGMRAGCEAVIERHDLPAHAVALGPKGCVSHNAELAALIWLWFVTGGLFVTPGEQEWSLTVAHDAEAVDRYVEVFSGLAAALSPRPSGSARA